jgi:hypothetical protein
MLAGVKRQQGCDHWLSHLQEDEHPGADQAPAWNSRNRCSIPIEDLFCFLLMTRASRSQSDGE